MGCSVHSKDSLCVNEGSAGQKSYAVGSFRSSMPEPSCCLAPHCHLMSVCMHPPAHGDTTCGVILPYLVAVVSICPMFCVFGTIYMACQGQAIKPKALVDRAMARGAHESPSNPFCERPEESEESEEHKSRHSHVSIHVSEGQRQAAGNPVQPWDDNAAGVGVAHVLVEPPRHFLGSTDQGGDGHDILAVDTSRRTLHNNDAKGHACEDLASRSCTEHSERIA